MGHMAEKAELNSSSENDLQTEKDKTNIVSQKLKPSTSEETQRATSCLSQDSWFLQTEISFAQASRI